MSLLETRELLSRSPPTSPLLRSASASTTLKSTKMATSVPTIIDLKTSFLRAQILALQKPLRPSSDFSISGEENALRQKSIDDALNKLNGLLKRHNKVAYGPQAQRHVAEQVDRLYWNAGERSIVGDVEDWMRRGADYRTW